jgi:hypothetical protein
LKRRRAKHVDERRHERLKERVKKLELAMARMAQHTHRLDDGRFTDTPWFPADADENDGAAVEPPDLSVTISHSVQA